MEEDRLLTQKEINEMEVSRVGVPYPPEVAKLQDTKTARILTEAHQKEMQWLDDARNYVASHKRLAQEDKAMYMTSLNYSNVNAWKDYIVDYTPQDAIDEDLSYAD